MPHKSGKASYPPSKGHPGKMPMMPDKAMKPMHGKMMGGRRVGPPSAKPTGGRKVGRR